MSPYKLLIFDWDGTLCDSVHTIVHCISLAAQSLQLPAHKEQQLRNIIGLKLDTAILALYPSLTMAEVDDFIDAYKHYFAIQIKQPPQLFPTVKETLLTLKDQGFLLAVATGKGRAGLDYILDALTLSDFFDATRCADETAGKPNPLMLNDLLTHFKLTPQQALMVGDASFDLQMANSAHVPAIAVTYGAQSKKQLMPYHPLQFIDLFEELLQHL